MESDVTHFYITRNCGAACDKFCKQSYRLLSTDEMAVTSK
jgi:hypothetical protein